MDGSEKTWPARGSLATNVTAITEVDRAVRAWRTPQGDKARTQTSAILWLGDVDGTVLGLVAADIPGRGDSWLLHVTGQLGALHVSRNTRSTHPGALVYSDVLPVRGADNTTRYLASTRVERLTVATATVALTDGLSAPIPLPACAPTVITATRVATHTLAKAGTTARFVDLGSNVAEPHYPLITDQGATATKIFQSMSVCEFSAPQGPFSAVRETSNTHGVPGWAAPWPMGDMAVRGPAETITVGTTTGTLEILDWKTASGLMSAAVWRSGDETSASVADRGQPVQAFTVHVGEQSLLVVTWDPTSEDEPVLPAEAQRMLSKPGLAVLPALAAGTKISMTVPGAAKPFIRTLS